MLNSLSQAAVIALCAFLIALVGLTWYKQGMPPFVPEHSNNGQAQGTIERDYSAEGEKGDSKASSTEGPNRQAKEKNENADAALANYTFWLTAFTAVLALATVALFIATVGLWAYAAEQARDMKESIAASRNVANAVGLQARIAQSALVASSRPWVQITDAVVTKLEVQADQVSVWADFLFKGIGPSPATAVAISPALLVPGLERWPHVETRRLCSEVKTINKVVGDALFPGDVGKLSMNFGRPMRDLIAGRDAHTREMIEGWRSAWGEEEAERLAAGLAQTANYTGFDLIACLAYKFAGSDEVHVTSFAAQLVRSHAEIHNGITSEVFDITRPSIIPQEDLKLTPLLLGKIAD